MLATRCCCCCRCCCFCCLCLSSIYQELLVLLNSVDEIKKRRSGQKRHLEGPETQQQLQGRPAAARIEAGLKRQLASLVGGDDSRLKQLKKKRFNCQDTWNKAKKRDRHCSSSSSGGLLQLPQLPLSPSSSSSSSSKSQHQQRVPNLAVYGDLELTKAAAACSREAQELETNDPQPSAAVKLQHPACLLIWLPFGSSLEETLSQRRLLVWRGPASVSLSGLWVLSPPFAATLPCLLSIFFGAKSLTEAFALLLLLFFSVAAGVSPTKCLLRPGGAGIEFVSSQGPL
ncbi:hypothetical protein Emed_001189 [Eimeria media]